MRIHPICQNLCLLSRAPLSRLTRTFPRATFPYSVPVCLKRDSPGGPVATSALLTTPKPLTVWITTDYGKFLDMGIPNHLTCLLRNLYAGQEAIVRTGHGTTDWFQLAVKEYVKAVYHPSYLTYMQSTFCKMLGWMQHKLESRLLGETPITSDMQRTPPLWQKAKKN